MNWLWERKKKTNESPLNKLFWFHVNCFLAIATKHISYPTGIFCSYSMFMFSKITLHFLYNSFSWTIPQLLLVQVQFTTRRSCSICWPSSQLRICSYIYCWCRNVVFSRQKRARINKANGKKISPLSDWTAFECLRQVSPLKKMDFEKELRLNSTRLLPAIHPSGYIYFVRSSGWSLVVPFWHCFHPSLFARYQPNALIFMTFLSRCFCRNMPPSLLSSTLFGISNIRHHSIQCMARFRLVICHAQTRPHSLRDWWKMCCTTTAAEEFFFSPS